MSQAGIASLNNIHPGQLDLHVAKLIVNVNGTVGTGANYSSLTSAMAAAVSGDTIFLMPGTYTENVTLTPGVAVSSFDCDGLNGNVIINGTLTMTGAGICTLSGMELKTNSAPFLIVSGSAASIVFLENCVVNCSNNTGISHTSSSASSVIGIKRCFGSVFGGGTTLFTSTSPGELNLSYCSIGTATTASTSTAGFHTITNSEINFPITTSGTCSLLCFFSLFNNSVTSFTIGGSGPNSIDNCTIEGSTQSAISIGSALTLTNSTVNSSNTNAITGVGTLTYSDITFSGSSSLINTTTKVALQTKLGSLNLLTPLSVSSPQTLVRDSVTGAVGVSTSGGFSWSDTSGTFSAVSGNGYFITATATANLPASPTEGDTIKFIVDNASQVLTIQANTGQKIRIGDLINGATAGTCTSQFQGDGISLVYRSTGATWFAENAPQGTWTLS